MNGKTGNGGKKFLDKVTQLFTRKSMGEASVHDEPGRHRDQENRNANHQRSKSGKEPQVQRKGGLGGLLDDNHKYNAIRFLGSGSYGMVVLAENLETGTKVATKLLPRGKKIDERVLREVRNHRRLAHPNVVKFHEVFLTKSHLCIVMDFAPGKNLLAYVAERGHLSEKAARHVFHQLILAIHNCHEKQIVNRDIKLDNTLLDNEDPPNIMICDFGYSKSLECDSLPNSRVGTPQYLAPEVILSNPQSGYDAKKADVWSCGVFLYAMLVGQYPFADSRHSHREDKLQRLIQRIMDGKFVTPDSLSEQAKDLIKKMVNGNLKERITMDEIKEHPWFAVDRASDFERKWNGEFEFQSASHQSEEEIEWIVKAAKDTSTTKKDLDEMIHVATTMEPSNPGSDEDWVVMGGVK